MRGILTSVGVKILKGNITIKGHANQRDGEAHSSSAFHEEIK